MTPTSHRATGSTSWRASATSSLARDLGSTPSSRSFRSTSCANCDPTGSNSSWQDEPRATLPNGNTTGFGVSSDLDGLSQAYVQRFRLLVVRRSPSAGRPPSNFTLAYNGRFYEVWRRSGPAPPQHVGLGTPLEPGGVASCAAIRQLSGQGTRLAYVERPLLPILLPASDHYPRYWHPDPSDPSSLVPVGAGALTGDVDLQQAGQYRIWVQGSFARALAVSVDGRRVGSVSRGLNGRGQFAAAGQVTLPAGRHKIRLVRAGGGLYPGDGSRDQRIGPIVLDPASDTRTVRELPASRWRDLCGRRLDWVEAIR